MQRWDAETFFTRKRAIRSLDLCVFSFLQDMSKSPKNMKKLLPKRKPERKPSEEDVTVRKSEWKFLSK